jgi:PAS domain S-box-containing protein
VQPFLRVSPDARTDLDFVVEIDAQPAPGELRDALSQAFGDPSLELAFWLPDGNSYVDSDGRPVPLPAEEGHRRTTFVVGSDGPVAALVHDTSLATDPAFVRSICTAAASALAGARRHTELRARLADVTGSRARIVEAAHELTELESGARRLTLTGHGPADTISGLLRGDPASATARVADAEGLVTRLDTLSPDEERLNALIGAAPVAVLEVDLDTRVVRWNAAAERIYGWRADEVLGERVPLVPPDREAEFQWLLGRVRAGHAYTGFETVRRRKDGSLVDVEIAAAPVRDESGEIVSHIVVFTDISERKRAERELRLSRAQVVEAGDAERRRLERNLHDGAQQRLVSLSLELGLLEQRFRDDAEAQHAIDQARRELAESLQELRDLARGIHPVIVTGHGLAVAAESLAARCPVPVELDLELGERPPEVVEVAAYYLLAEALTNVAKYARASRATVEIRRSNGSLIVEVTDDGVGGADAAAGSGLRGLTDRIDALGGHLRVWSPEGGGTRIRAELPCE